jgi:hypothetical protein
MISLLGKKIKIVISPCGVLAIMYVKNTNLSIADVTAE